MFNEVKKINKKLAFRLAISAIIAIVVATGALFFTVTRVKHVQYCGKCHSDVTFNNICSNIVSGNITCIDCHAHENSGSLKRMAVDMTDEHCTSEQCHSLNKLSEKSIQFKGTKDFRHSTHTTNYPGNLTMRCVSCHSNLHGEKHFETDIDTCNLCHFINTQQLLTKEERPISECSLCHNSVKRTIQIYNNTFDHIVYEERGNVSCSECHFAVIQGKGTVVRENCHVCHQTIMGNYTAPDMHETHIMKHKTSCVPCHNTIVHTSIKKNGLVLSNIQNLTFDLSLYKTQYMIMAGTGGKGIAEEPDPMFIATLNCSACHKNELLSKVEPTVCNNCHDKGFDKILSEQMSFVSKRMRLLKVLLKKAKKPPLTETNPFVTEAESNYYFIKEDGSNGAHNVKYVKDLLEYSIMKLTLILQKNT
ncbi:MAG: hypothetical protein E3K37_04495 [Candidatus Kuenenia sp.]|nr:hypothetical protein [Candidatus Kuenenia hertensis]